MMPMQINRREMLKNATMVGVGSWLSYGTSGRAENSPNEKLNIAIIGAGGRGASNLAGVAGENIVALCDVDERRAAQSFSKYRSAKRYHDYRKMLDEMDQQIDAVVVSTPNHIHAPASVTAMRMGKHCYCEKPLAHSVYESRVAAQVAAKHNVATQMGTQIHATENYRRVVELIRSGAIGETREVHIRLAGGGTAGDRPRETQAVPQQLHWDLWLGPAPHRPYNSGYVPHDWHYWWDFGGGPLGNMGCHYLDLAFWALDLRYPTTITAEGPPVHPESTPRPMKARWEFPARGKLPPVTLTWDHGRARPKFWQEHELPDWAWGVFVGSKGMLLANYAQHALWPADRFADFKPPEPEIPASIGHHQEWIVACKTGSSTTCNFDYSGAVTEAVLLANVAYRSGKTIDWDPVDLKVTNVPEANAYLRREYRRGWTL
jgi:predicted dehydrogenase